MVEFCIWLHNFLTWKMENAMQLCTGIGKGNAIGNGILTCVNYDRLRKQSSAANSSRGLVYTVNTNTHLSVK